MHTTSKPKQLTSSGINNLCYTSRPLQCHVTQRKLHGVTVTTIGFMHTSINFVEWSRVPTTPFNYMHYPVWWLRHGCFFLALDHFSWNALTFGDRPNCFERRNDKSSIFVYCRI